MQPLLLLLLFKCQLLYSVARLNDRHIKPFSFFIALFDFIITLDDLQFLPPALGVGGFKSLLECRLDV